jgi:hypothetical protein
MANFPLVTWPVALTGVTVTYHGGGPYNVADVTGYGFGVSNTATGAASVDVGGVVGSIAGNFAAAVNAAIPGANPLSASYLYTNGTAPALGPLKAFFGVTGLYSVSIDFGSAAMASVLGYSTQVVTMIVAGGSTTPFNVGGAWMPNGVAGDVRRYLTQRAAASSNEMSGLATDVVNWGQIVDLELMSSAFYAANVARYFAATQIYATAAGRLVADPNNTLEGMVEAAAGGALFRLYREAATAEGTTPGYYQPARMPAVAQQGKAVDMVAALDEPRLWNSSGIFFRATQ